MKAELYVQGNAMYKNMLVLILFLLSSGFSIAGDVHACKGKITSIVTRATSEDTQVTIEGLNGYARIGFGGATYRHLHDRQFAMLLAASMSNTEVSLEFLDASGKCTDKHVASLIRYVAINP
jgi:hypothetical protein